jgi:hypothetical protein
MNMSSKPHTESQPAAGAPNPERTHSAPAIRRPSKRIPERAGTRAARVAPKPKKANKQSDPLAFAICKNDSKHFALQITQGNSKQIAFTPESYATISKALKDLIEQLKANPSQHIPYVDLDEPFIDLNECYRSITKQPDSGSVREQLHQLTELLADVDTDEAAAAATVSIKHQPRGSTKKQLDPKLQRLFIECQSSPADTLSAYELFKLRRTELRHRTSNLATPSLQPQSVLTTPQPNHLQPQLMGAPPFTSVPLTYSQIPPCMGGPGYWVPNPMQPFMPMPLQGQVLPSMPQPVIGPAGYWAPTYTPRFIPMLQELAPPAYGYLPTSMPQPVYTHHQPPTHPNNSTTAQLAADMHIRETEQQVTHHYVP